MTTLTIPVVRVDKQLLTAAELAAAIGVSVSGLLSLVGRELLPPARKFGTRTRWVASDVERALGRLPQKTPRKGTPKAMAHTNCAARAAVRRGGKSAHSE